MKQLAILFCICYPFILPVGSGTPAARRATPMNVGPYIMIREAESMVKEGDLFVRLNRDLSSRFISQFSPRDKSFSHAGIVFYEHGIPFVFHMVSGEGDTSNKMKKDLLKDFCNPRKNSAFGIYRYQIKSAELNRLKSIIHQWYESGIRFDFTFNLDSDDSMYCSEMVSKALAKATEKRITIATTQLTTTEATMFSIYCHVPIASARNMRIVPIDNLYLNANCRVVKRCYYSLY
jgi:hypothetical protein